MITVQDYIDKVKTVKEQILDETSKAVYQHEVEIIKLNTEDQLLNRGVNIEGGLLGLYSHTYLPKADSIIRGYPKTKNKRYNFLESGRLYNDMSIRVVNNQVLFENSDTGNKLLELRSLVGADFIGLTSDNEYRLNYEIIQPELFKFIQKYL